MDQFERIIERYGPAFMDQIAAPVWEAAVRQVFISGVIGTVICSLVVLGGLVALAWGAFSSGKQQYNNTEASDGRLLAMVLGGGLSGLVFVLVLPMFVGQLLNPTWYAIQNLGELVR